MDKIGSCVGSCGSVCCNKGEIECYFGGLIGVGGNNEKFI